MTKLNRPTDFRARAALAQEAVGPSDEELDGLFSSHCYTNDYGSELMDLELFRDGARAVLARWGSAPRPIPVAERLPGAEDCISNPRTGEGHWCWGWAQERPSPFAGRWRMFPLDCLAEEACYWLPAHALPLPAQEGADG